MPVFKSKDILSLFSSHKIHFHNGVVQAGTGANIARLWHFCPIFKLNPHFPAYSWIQKHLSKNKENPLIGYALFVPSPRVKEAKDRSHVLPNKVLSSGEKEVKQHQGDLSCAKDHLILHVHFSFDENYETTVLKGQSLPDRGLSPAFNIKNFIFLSPSAKLTLVESFELTGKLKTPIHTTTYFQSQPHSSLHWLNVQKGEASSSLFCETQGEVQSHSAVHRLSLAFSKGHTKDFVTVRHTQKKARSLLLSLALLQQKAQREQEWDTKVGESEGYSRQYFKGILNDRARSVFRGKVFISPQALSSDCAQSAKSFLLSPKAHSLMRPEMEVHCGEVKAQHGATTGQLNQEELFYLQSRGLLEAEAFEILLMAHVKGILEFFPEKRITEKIFKNIQQNKKKYLNLLTPPHLIP